MLKVLHRECVSRRHSAPFSNTNFFCPRPHCDWVPLASRSSHLQVSRIVGITSRAHNTAQNKLFSHCRFVLWRCCAQLRIAFVMHQLLRYAGFSQPEFSFRFRGPAHYSPCLLTRLTVPLPTVVVSFARSLHLWELRSWPLDWVLWARKSLNRRWHKLPRQRNC